MRWNLLKKQPSEEIDSSTSPADDEPKEPGPDDPFSYDIWTDDSQTDDEPEEQEQEVVWIGPKGTVGDWVIAILEIIFS